MSITSVSGLVAGSSDDCENRVSLIGFQGLLGAQQLDDDNLLLLKSVGWGVRSPLYSSFGSDNTFIGAYWRIRDMHHREFSDEDIDSQVKPDKLI